MKRVLLLLSFLTLFPACALISVTQKHYKQDIGNAPKEKLLSFDSQQALEVGATLNNQVANDIFYNGTEPKSDKAKIILDMSYKFMAFLGVNTNFDLTDPEALKKTFAEIDSAASEKDKNIADLRIAVDDYRTKLEGEKKIVRDKEEEIKAQDGQWSAKWGSLFYCFIGFVIFIIIGAILIQIYTGIPVATGIFTGSLKTFGKLTQQTVSGIEKFKTSLTEVKEDAASTTAEKEEADYWKTKLSSTLAEVHDDDVKSLINKYKDKLR